MPGLKLAAQGRITFNLGPLFNTKETGPDPRSPSIFFLELGRWPPPGSKADMELISNMVATPAFFKK